MQTKAALYGVLLLSSFAFHAVSADVTKDDFSRHIMLRSEITVGSESLEGFAALVRLGAHIDGFTYADFGQADGTDLCFFDADGAVLPYEIQTWDPSGESLVWVRLPELSQGTVFYACYGRDAVTPNEPSDVWGGYASVWHFEGADDDGYSPDSTANHYDALNGAELTDAVGVIGGARAQLSASTPGDYGIVVPSSTSLVVGTTYTLSGWVWHENVAAKSDSLFFRRNTTSDASGWAVHLWNNLIGTFGVYGKGNNMSYYNSGLTNGKWYYLSVVFNGNNIAVYNNGVLQSQYNKNIADPSTLPVAIGTNSDRTAAPWMGRFDECRIRLAADSATRIAADYATMSDPASLSYGTVQTVGDPVLADYPVISRLGPKLFGIDATLSGGKGELLAVGNSVIYSALRISRHAKNRPAPFDLGPRVRTRTRTRTRTGFCKLAIHYHHI